MEDINFKNNLLKLLQYYYNFYVKILYNYINHIERSYKNNYLTINDRNIYLKSLNDIINKLNTEYNKNIEILRFSNKNILDSSEIFEFNDEQNINSSFDTTLRKDIRKDIMKKLIDFKDYDLINVLSIDELFNDKIYFFSNIRDDIIALSKNIGFYSIKEMFKIFIGQRYKKIIQSQTEEIQDFLNLLNNTFIISKFIDISQSKKDNLIQTKLNDSKQEHIIHKYVEIIIDLSKIKKRFHFIGYFLNDPLNINILTSQISNKFIYNKKKEIYQLIEKNKNKKFNITFKKSYFKNINLSDLICMNTKELYDLFVSDYNRYQKYSKLNFKTLMQEFIKDDITIYTQFDIIRLLLISKNEESENMAGLLYGITKDKKIGSDIISNIIYNNLTFDLQNKLKKSIFSIKNELDKIKSISVDDIDLKKQVIMNKNIPNNIKKIIFDKIEEMKSNSSDYYKQKTYTDILINFPWNNQKDIFSELSNNFDDSKNFINKLKDVLNKKVYGHDECKTNMQELIGKWISNPNSSGKSIGLIGPPGVGKTLIAKSLGEALNIPFTQINLGGMEDRSILSGHSYTYSGAQPGLIIRKMIEAGQSRCIIYFDELDKTSTKHGINEIHNVLIHVTDQNTNMNFNDSFFNEVTFPLNKVLFVFSFNDPDKVDKILLDRMEKIEVKPYTIDDKIKITREFLLNEISSEMNKPPNFINISDNDIEFIIDNYTFEAGLRELKRLLEKIFSKTNLEYIFGTINSNNNIHIDKNKIISYLNKPNLPIKKIHNEHFIGLVNALYATNTGYGGIIPILVYDNFTGNKFTLKLTGSQGNIMKESIQFAFTTAMNILKPNFRNSFLNNNKYGLHIHTPDAATPKDGPSAGSAFTTAFISKILNLPVKNDIAMTGEIEINGNITSIGSLHYKLKGALKANVKTVFIPFDNYDDLNKINLIDPNLLNKLNIIPVKHIKDILKYSLIYNNNLDYTYYFN